jgi:hypothetical protein
MFCETARLSRLSKSLHHHTKKFTPQSIPWVSEVSSRHRPHTNEKYHPGKRWRGCFIVAEDVVRPSGKNSRKLLSLKDWRSYQSNLSLLSSIFVRNACYSCSGANHSRLNFNSSNSLIRIPCLSQISFFKNTAFQYHVFPVESTFENNFSTFLKTS